MFTVCTHCHLDVLYPLISEATTYLVELVPVVPDVLLLLWRCLHVQIIPAPGKNLPTGHHPPAFLQKIRFYNCLPESSRLVPASLFVGSLNRKSETGKIL